MLTRPFTSTITRSIGASRPFQWLAYCQNYPLGLKTSSFVDWSTWALTWAHQRQRGKNHGNRLGAYWQGTWSQQRGNPAVPEWRSLALN